MSTVQVQLGLFAGCAEVADMHTVSAHTRLLSDGSEVFVGEHLRWNAGKRAEGLRVERVTRPPASPDQLGLFDSDGDDVDLSASTAPFPW